MAQERNYRINVAALITGDNLVMSMMDREHVGIVYTGSNDPGYKLALYKRNPDDPMKCDYMWQDDHGPDKEEALFYLAEQFDLNVE